MHAPIKAIQTMNVVMNKTGIDHRMWRDSSLIDVVVQLLFCALDGSPHGIVGEEEIILDVIEEFTAINLLLSGVEDVVVCIFRSD